MSRRAAMGIVLVVVVVAGLVGCAVQLPGQQADPASSPPYRLRAVAGYIVPEDARGVTAINNGILTEISPVWYQPAESGQLVFASSEAERSARGVETAALSHHVAIVPSISNYRNGRWDGPLIHRIITDPPVRQAHVTAIVGLVTSHHWNGIDLDYESLAASDRSAYSAFVADLATALHQAGKRLTVTVHAKVAEPGDWSGARAQDWRMLGSAADEIRVMAYDYSTEDAPAGAIAPLPWVERVLQLAISEVPRSKLMLGVAAYGYDWISGQQGNAVQSADAQAIARAHAASGQWDAASQSPWFTYTDRQGREHTVWYEDARSLNAKIALAIQYQVNGIVIWRLGGEDPAIWAEIRQAT